MKLGLWLLIVLAAFLWFNHAQKKRLKKRAEADAAKAPPAAAHLETIVACAHCGLHVPASDATVSETGASFCSEAHRRLHPPA